MSDVQYICLVGIISVSVISIHYVIASWGKAILKKLDEVKR